VRAEVHVGGVEPHEERRSVTVLTADEVFRGNQELIVDGLHPFARERSRVFNASVGKAMDYPRADRNPF
jgi:hypothetical protein